MKVFLKSIACLFIFLSIFFSFSSCEDEKFSNNPNHVLSFSVDTLRFDTVFTTLGSSTKRIMVYNRNKDALRISRIGLANGSSSVFKINVNGSNTANHQFTDIEISGKDSMYIFVAVKVEELGVNTPVFIEEDLRFETNGVAQNVVLNTYGQDVEFLRGRFIYSDSTLTGDKPYVVYDSLVVMPEKTLTLEAGCRLYFHNNAKMMVFGNLISEGQKENPVIIRGDRFDKINYSSPVPYNDVAGQWRGIYLIGTNAKHRLNYTQINSGYFGLWMQNNDENIIPSVGNVPSLEIINCKIHNFIQYGLCVVNGDVTVINSQISNSGDYTVFLNGGEHTFIHSTIANYFNNGSNIQADSRKSDAPALMIENISKSIPMQTTLINCVVMGTVENEFSLASRFPEQYNGTFESSYFRRSEPYTTNQYQHIRWYESKDRVFKNIYYSIPEYAYFNFEPDSLSPLRGLGNTEVLQNPEYAVYLQEDLNGNIRPTEEAPDAGAYQWQPTNK